VKRLPARLLPARRLSGRIWRPARLSELPRRRFGDAFGRTYFRRFGPGVASSIGLGTYLGDPIPAVDDASREAIDLALRSGVNHVDTAVNYRCGRAERVVGEAVRTPRSTATRSW